MTTTNELDLLRHRVNAAAREHAKVEAYSNAIGLMCSGLVTALMEESEFSFDDAVVGVAECLAVARMNLLQGLVQ